MKDEEMRRCKCASEAARLIAEHVAGPEHRPRRPSNPIEDAALASGCCVIPSLAACSLGWLWAARWLGVL